MELYLGKMTWRDLARWFGLNEDAFSHGGTKRREKKLAILKSYADYHLENNGKALYIDRIWVKEYRKSYDIIDREFSNEWDKTGVDTCSRVGQAIWARYGELNQIIQVSTAQNYTRKVKQDRYGKNNKEGGTHGTSSYRWMQEDGKTPLTKEQWDVMHKCIKQAYENDDILRFAVEEDFKGGKITEKQRDERLAKIDKSNAYATARAEIIKKLGFYPTRKTKLKNYEQGALGIAELET